MGNLLIAMEHQREEVRLDRTSAFFMYVQFTGSHSEGGKRLLLL